MQIDTTAAPDSTRKILALVGKYDYYVPSTQTYDQGVINLNGDMDSNLADWNITDFLSILQETAKLEETKLNAARMQFALLALFITCSIAIPLIIIRCGPTLRARHQEPLLAHVAPPVPMRQIQVIAADDAEGQVEEPGAAPANRISP